MNGLEVKAWQAHMFQPLCLQIDCVSNSSNSPFIISDSLIFFSSSCTRYSFWPLAREAPYWNVLPPYGDGGGCKFLPEWFEALFCPHRNGQFLVLVQKACQDGLCTFDDTNAPGSKFVSRKFRPLWPLFRLSVLWSPRRSINPNMAHSWLMGHIWLVIIRAFVAMQASVTITRVLGVK